MIKFGDKIGSKIDYLQIMLLLIWKDYQEFNIVFSQQGNLVRLMNEMFIYRYIFFYGRNNYKIQFKILEKVYFFEIFSN